MTQTNLPFEHDKELFAKWRNSEYYSEKIKQRVKVIDACNRAKDARVIAKQLCKEDPIFFIEMIGWTYDPRPQHDPHNLPFIMFDYQKDVVYWLVKHVQEGQDGLVEKYRDMGVTWLNGYGAGETLGQFGHAYNPQMWVIGRDGRIAWNENSDVSLEEGIEGALVVDTEKDQ